jgi:hypothetical protein
LDASARGDRSGHGIGGLTRKNQIARHDGTPVDMIARVLVMRGSGLFEPEGAFAGLCVCFG